MESAADFIPIKSGGEELLRELKKKINRLESPIDQEQVREPWSPEHIGVPVLRALRNKSPKLTEHARYSKRVRHRYSSERDNAQSQKSHDELMAIESLKRRNMYQYYHNVRAISKHPDAVSFLSDIDTINSHGISVSEEDAPYISRLSKILQCVDNINLNAPGHIIRAHANNPDLFRHMPIYDTSCGAKLYCQQINNKITLAHQDTEFTCLEAMLLALTHTLLKKWKD